MLFIAVILYTVTFIVKIAMEAFLHFSLEECTAWKSSRFSADSWHQWRPYIWLQVQEFIVPVKLAFLCDWSVCVAFVCKSMRQKKVVIHNFEGWPTVRLYLIFLVCVECKWVNDPEAPGFLCLVQQVYRELLLFVWLIEWKSFITYHISISCYEIIKEQCWIKNTFCFAPEDWLCGKEVHGNR